MAAQVKWPGGVATYEDVLNAGRLDSYRLKALVRDAVKAGLRSVITDALEGK